MITRLIFMDRNYIYNKSRCTDCSCDLWMVDIFKEICNSDYFVNNVLKDYSNLINIDCDTIKYRQRIIKDFNSNRDILNKMYLFFKDCSMLLEKQRYEIDYKNPTHSFYSAVQIMNMYIPNLKKLTVFLNKTKDRFNSQGILSFINNYLSKFNEQNIIDLENLFFDLSFKCGIYLEGSFDSNLELNKYKIYDCRLFINNRSDKASYKNSNLNINDLSFSCLSKDSYNVSLDEEKKFKHAKMINKEFRNKSSEQSYERQTDKALIEFSNLVVPFVEDVIDFFKSMYSELAYYVGAINLINYCEKEDIDYTYPQISNKVNFFKCNNLYDLALRIKKRADIVGNNIEYSNCNIMFITGANQGGKTTFLRSYGQAMILFKMGFVVPAKELVCNYYGKLYAHFTKEEDSKMVSGKLEDELKRIRLVIESIKQNDILLLNESFASTNEKEGSLIAFDILKALIECGIKIVFVSHLQSLSKMLENHYHNAVCFYRAERLDDGRRTYNLVPGKPFKTSYAIDLYNEIFIKGE